MEGGIKARSVRGTIGETWWSRRFIAVLESLGVGGRLGRGKNYARQGQVLSLEVAPGVVSAVVQGSRDEPYTLTIRFAPVPDWRPVEDAIAARALFSAQLLAGEMPAALEEVFDAAGVPLFPRRSRDLVMQCSCPDYAVPCKHIAATFYLLAEAFDADPFQILLWRGRGRDELLAHLGPATLFEEQVPGVFDEVRLPPLDEVIDRYWVAPVPLPTRPTTLDTATDLLLRQLPTPGAGLGGSALIERLRPLYAAFAVEE
ncbi:hypothetical protein Rhe02_46820 [Rhizocola hellebori]|uniref:SWIM-type domain-containing protein n=1 Tax=Rhizocola hellebori TaxID=1392758 RepID=A0A8J3Q9V6_9ACTN|nr:hypothetical protein Rhe02_46820 [Rhizocola hellebori]